MQGPTLHHADILGSRDAIHLARATVLPVRPKYLHGHDFFELLWVQNGRIRHHLPEGWTDLLEGDLAFIRPQDTHALQGRGEEPLVVSVTLHPETVAAIAKRHAELAGRFFWSGAERPVILRRDSRELAALNASARRLEAGERGTLAAEGFLLPLLASLMEEVIDLPEGAPAWLYEACSAAKDPAVFRDGAAGFVRVAGRAHPHVSRTARRFLGRSPSDYVNVQRMKWAARRLTGTSDTLTEIAADCGIPNLSHFHKLFRAHHGMTPQKFRKAHQRDVVQP